jgi:hypothetical protein
MSTCDGRREPVGRISGRDRLISRTGVDENLRPMITLLLHLLRLLPFLCGGHRELALENLALRQQLAASRER